MKKIVIYVAIITLIIGFLFGINNSFDLSNFVTFGFSFKYFLYYFCLIILLSFLTFLCVPSYFILIMFEFFSIGFLLWLFIKNFYLKGLGFVLVFFLIYKMFLIFGYYLNNFYFCKYVKNLYRYVFKKGSKRYVVLYVKKIWIISFFLIGYYFILNTLFFKIGCKFLVMLIK